jgi:hypothetical protein
MGYLIGQRELTEDWNMPSEPEPIHGFPTFCSQHLKDHLNLAARQKRSDGIK